jgi:hypothetical protein
MVELYRLAEDYWFFHKSSLAIPEQSNLVAKHMELGEENNEFGLTKYLWSYFEGFFNMP